MAEIDEAAAVEWLEWASKTFIHIAGYARTALAWKARAEAAEAERDSLRRAINHLHRCVIDQATEEGALPWNNDMISALKETRDVLKRGKVIE